jgi:predicted amidohydrolase
MKICALELPADFGDPDGRLADVRSALERGEPADLVLLPECALTGYVSAEGACELQRFAEPLDGPTLGAYRALARQHRIHLAGPLVEESAGACFNTFVVVDREGDLRGHYRKRHPWFPETWATKGSLPYPAIELGGLRLTLAICYDVHFLAREAADTLAWADVLLFPSAWVDDGAVDLRAGLLGALVRQFGLTVVNANWGAGRPRLRGQGRSRIVGPEGGVEAPGRNGRVSRVAAAIARKPGRDPTPPG